MASSSGLSIGLTMFLRDQFSGPASKIKNSSQSVQAEMRKLQEEQLRHTRNLNAGVAMAGAAALTGMGRAIGEAAKFGYEMEFVKSITAATNAEAARLGTLGMRLGQETMFFAQDVAEGMRFMAMAGMQAQEVEKNIQGAVRLAGATKSLLGGKGGSADIMTNVMKQFQISFEYTNQVADILAYGVTRANTNLFDLGEAVKYAGSTSMDLNVSLQETVAMVMALGNAGMQGSMAGVAMENSMRYMTRAFSTFGSGPSKKALSELGLDIKDVTDSQGNLISMTEVMKKMGQAIDANFGSGMNVQKQNILQNIFGVRGKRAASLFLRNLKEFDKFSGEISTKSIGHASNIMGDMMDTLQGQILRTQSAWKNLWVKFTQGIEPTLKWVLNVAERIFTGIQKIFETPVLGPMLATGIAGFITITTVSSAYRAVAAGIKLLHLQMGGAMASTTASTVAGYNTMTAAANRYRVTAAGSGGMWGYSGKAFRGGGGYYVNVPGGGSRFFKSATAAGKAARGLHGVKATGAGAMMGIGRMSLAAGGRGMAAGALGRVLGFLGGPLGLALSFGLPMAIGALTSALNRNKDSVDENTDSLGKSNKLGEARIIYESEFEPVPDLGAKLHLMRAMNSSFTGFNDASKADRLRSQVFDDQGNTRGNYRDIIINLDGDTIFKNPVDSLAKEFKSVGVYY